MCIYKIPYFGLSNSLSKFSEVVLHGMRFYFKKKKSRDVDKYTMKTALKSTISLQTKTVVAKVLSSVYMDGNKCLQDQHLKWVLQEVTAEQESQTEKKGKDVAQFYTFNSYDRLLR